MDNLIETCIKQIKEHTTIDDDLHYCCEVAYNMLSEVLNKKYYPNMTDEQIQHIIQQQVIRTVACIELYKVPKVAMWIKELDKELHTYYADNYLLYLNDDDSLYANVVSYLCELFSNIV